MNDEFELISVKELKNLKEELIELKKSPKIKSNSNNPKEYVNIFNSISRIENKFEITIKNLNKMMNKLDKITSIFDADIQTEEEDVNKLNELILRLTIFLIFFFWGKTLSKDFFNNLFIFFIYIFPIFCIFIYL